MEISKKGGHRTQKAGEHFNSKIIFAFINPISEWSLFFKKYFQKKNIFRKPSYFTFLETIIIKFPLPWPRWLLT